MVAGVFSAFVMKFVREFLEGERELIVGFVLAILQKRDIKSERCVLEVFVGV